MAKLIRILAASLGGGLVLGAGIRLGERLVSSGNAASGTSGFGDSAPVTGVLAARLGELEGRLSHLETAGLSTSADTGAPTAPLVDLTGLESRMAAQAAEVSAVRVRLDAGARQAETLSLTDERLRTELRGWLDERVNERLRAVETTLRAESDEAQREMLNAVVESVQTRVIVRISRLEEEVAGQAAGMQELRECTLRTELSMQKLLGGIDRLIAAQPSAPLSAEPALRGPEAVREYAEARSVPEPEPAPAPADQPSEPQKDPVQLTPGGILSGEPLPRRRWNIFG